MVIEYCQRVKAISQALEHTVTENGRLMTLCRSRVIIGSSNSLSDQLFVIR